MKIQYALLISCLLLALQATAQQESQAQKILRQLAENNQAYQSIQADFSFHYESLQSEQENTWEGHIKMKGRKYQLQLRQSTVYYDGQTLWNHLHDVNEVNISEPLQQENTDILNHPHQIFDIHQMDFKSQYLGEEQRNNQQLYKVDLFPKELDRDYSRISLFLEQSPVQIHSARIHGKDGSIYTIEIENLVTNQPVPDSTFVFDESAHPDVEVIDMRF